MNTLAIFASRPSPEVREGLRMVAALVAAGDTPHVVVLDGGSLDPAQLDDESARMLETLTDFGVVPEAVDAVGLVEAIADATRLIRVGAADRKHEPPLLVVDEAVLQAGRDDPEAFLATLIAAGQVVLL